jgi:uncharacterized OsmC-like protein
MATFNLVGSKNITKPVNNLSLQQNSNEESIMAEQLVMTISQTSDYKFEVDFGAACNPIMADLPPPLGEGSAPSPEHLLLAAVANCLSASLLFALRKFKQNATDIKTTISCTVDRNEKNGCV